VFPDRQPGIGPLQLEEPLSRYITDRDYMKETAQAWRAFRPTPTDSEVSIGRIEELDEDGIWALGDGLAGSADRTVFGRRDMNLTVVRAARIPAAQLDAESTPEPPRHARIIGWPPGASVDERKALAMMLYASSVLHAKPGAINP
jgi:hypothetical protein